MKIILAAIACPPDGQPATATAISLPRAASRRGNPRRVVPPPQVATDPASLAGQALPVAASATRLEAIGIVLGSQSHAAGSGLAAAGTARGRADSVATGQGVPAP